MYFQGQAVVLDFLRLLDPEGEGTMLLRDVGNHSPNWTPLLPREYESSN